MAFQEFELNMIPHGDMPTFYASQYETGRPIIIDIMMGEDAFDCSELYIELHARKVDDNIVTLEPDSVDGNQVTFIGTDQLFACPGKNVAEICLYADDTKDTSLGSLNFFIEVEPDPLAGGLTSESSIYDLRQQIEEITEEVIGEDYYDKTEVDDLLDLKADKSNTYTKTEVDNALNLKADKSTTYTKSQVDSALALKVDASSVYTKGQTDTLLNAKANTSDLATVATTGSYDDLTDKPTIPAAQVQSDWSQADNTKVDYIKNKPDLNDYLTVSDYNSDMSDLNDALTNEFNAVEKTEIMNTGTENQTPYLTRTPTNVGNRCLEMLVGGTVAFNQLVQNGNFANTSGWSASGGNISISSNVLTFAPTTFSNAVLIQGNVMGTITGHKYYIKCDVKYNNKLPDGQPFLSSGGYQGIQKVINTLNEWDELSGIFIRSTGGDDRIKLYPHCNGWEDGDTVDVKNIVCIDLTQMFGSTIADYIYSLEQGTAGVGVAWFKKLFPNSYYAYNAGELMSVKTSAKKIYDANNTLIETYDLSGSRKVHRRYEQRAYQAGDESLPDTITDGTNTVTKLLTPFDETVTNPELRGIPKLDANNNLYYDGDTCNDFTNPQTVVSGGKEEFVDGRSVEIPVGHDTIYAKKTDYRYW